MIGHIVFILSHLSHLRIPTFSSQQSQQQALLLKVNTCESSLLDVRSVTPRPYPGYHLPEETVLISHFRGSATAIPIIVVRSLEHVIRYDKESDQKNCVIKEKDIHIHHPSLLNILKNEVPTWFRHPECAQSTMQSKHPY